MKRKKIKDGGYEVGRNLMDHYGTIALVGTTREPVTVRKVNEYNHLEPFCFENIESSCRDFLDAMMTY
jgi:hypothetical protein